MKLPEVGNIGQSTGTNETGPNLLPLVAHVEDLPKKEETLQEEYDPLKHGNAKHPTTYLETLVHLFKGTVGTGILSLPAAFIESGYLIGVLGILITCYFSTYSAYVLAISEVELCRRRKIPCMSYQATAEAAVEDGPAIFRPLSSISLHVCNCLLLVAQISSACVYLIFIASNIKAVTDVYIGVIDMRIMMLWVSVPLLGFSCIRRLKYLAPFSTLGSATVVASCAVVFYYMFQDTPSLSSRMALPRDVWLLPQFFGTVFFATGCIALVLPLQNEMKRPDRFTGVFGVLNFGSALVAALYIMFSLFGYLKYGDETAPSITLNLPKQHIASHIVQILLSLATLFGTTLTYYVSVIIIMENYIGPLVTKNRVPIEYCVRLVLVIITVCVAEGVPNLDLLVSLSGVLSQCSLATTIPCLIHMFTFHRVKRGKLSTLLFAQDVLIILLTSVVFFTGMTSNFKRVVALYN